MAMDIVARGLAQEAINAGGGSPTDITYAQLVSLIGSNGLTTGKQYRITDFATTHYIVDGNGTKYPSATPIIVGTAEPLIITANSENTIDSVVRSANYPQDIIHYDWNPNNWLYDISFSDADSEPATPTIIENFKGVITFRHDTIQDNYTGYDFRNVRFRRWKTNAVAWNSGTTYAKGYSVTYGNFIYYSSVDENTNHNVAVIGTSYWIKIIDLSYTEYWFNAPSSPQGSESFADLLTFNECGTAYEVSAFSNHIEPFKSDYILDYSGSSLLRNNVIHILNDQDNYYDSSSNTIESGAYGNTIGASSYGNTIGSGFSNNIIGSSFNSNAIGAFFDSNIIGSDFSNNVTASGFYGNIVGEDFYDNIIRSNFNRNAIVTEFFRNTIGSGFGGNTIGSRFVYNIVEDGVNNIVPGINFLSATHVYSNYNCKIFINSEGSARLQYYLVDVPTVVDANA